MTHPKPTHHDEAVAVKPEHRYPTWKEILRMAWPLVIANGFWNLQMTIDRVFLGKYSTDALAAVVAVAGVFWAPMALVQQAAAYVTVFVAQYFGAKREELVGPSVWQSVYVSVAGGLLFLLLIPAAPLLFELFGHSMLIQALEVQYFRSLCWSALPTALVAAASGFFTGIGRPSFVMWINGIGMAANALFAYFLIFGNWGFPRLGIAGAGYATTIASWAAALFGFAVILWGRDYEKRYRVRSGWRVHRELLGRFLKYGLPSGLQWALEGLAFTAFLIFVGRMPNGDAALAGSSITVTVMMVSVLPALGIAQAVSALVGQYLGDNRSDLAEAASWNGLKIALLYMGTAGLSFVLFPSFYLSWFENKETAALWNEVSRMVPYLLMFVAAFTLFDSANVVISFALKGAGDTRFVSAVALILPWPLMVFPSWLVRNRVDGIYLAWGAAAAYGMVLASVFLVRFRQGKWKQMRVM